MGMHEGGETEKPASVVIKLELRFRGRYITNQVDRMISDGG
jgi:hypothetical protein